MRVSRFSIWFCLLLFCLGAPVVAALAQTPITPEGGRAGIGFPRPPLESIPRLPSAEARSGLSLQPMSPGVEPWTRLAYQSLRDGNWEIYLNALDHSDDVRLTYDPAMDIEPRLNRGATKIVFVSNRDGDQEIYTMNIDGSGLTQLTFNADIRDNYPAWSPDGTRIAFVSNRDGNYQIYVMNADGSNQTRLTNLSNLQAIQPAWSPDGSQIAFTGNYYTSRIFVMNADGSNPRILNTQEYSENPSWSPDGNYIAYDADDDGNGFMELWVMAADGSTQVQVYNPTDGQTDAWMGSWSPDGRYLAFTQISWTYNNGNWYWKEAYVNALDLVLAGYYYLTSSGVDFFPDWQPTDITPPAASLQPLPRYSRGYALLQMSGDDGDGIGFAGFDVQYKDTLQGEWTDLVKVNPQRLALFAGDPGKTYEFRARGEDLFYNAEPWTQVESDARTTFYAWGISGRTLDTAGYPVGGAGVFASPTAMNNAASDYQGYYTAYVGTLAAGYSVSWGKTGYGSMPITDFPRHPDAQLDIYFPPSDDVVQDGGFESGALAPNWTSGGEISPTLVSSMTHTGSGAVLLGQPADPLAFITPTLVSNPSAISHTPALALCPDGSAHLVWEESGAIMHNSRRGDGAAWEVKTKLSGSLVSARPQIACDAGGGLHVVFVSTGAVYYTHKPALGGWTAPQKISATRQVDFPPRLAVRPDGYAHVMWGGDGVWHVSRAPGGAWSQPVEVPFDSHGFMEGIYDLQVALSPDGALHAIWWSKPELGVFNVYYGLCGFTGSWHVEEINDDLDHPFLTPQLAVGLDGRAHVVWLSNGRIFYRLRGLDGTWSTPSILSPLWAYAPFITVGPDGLAYVIYNVSGITYFRRQIHDDNWLEPEIVSEVGYVYSANIFVAPDDSVYIIYNSNQIYVIHRDKSGLWSSRIPVSQMDISEPPGIAMSEGVNRGIHAAWVDYTNKIFYAGPTLVEESADSRLTQTLSLPPDLHKPIVSLLYHLEGAASGGENQLSLALSQGVTPTVIFTTNLQQAGWAHQWIDVAPWVGQQVTLTLNLHQAQGEYPPVAVVDEISLGSWLTPVIDSVSPQPLEANKAIQVTISGENFIAPATVKIGSRAADTVEWLDENTLLAHFNQGAPPGMQLLIVTNPAGQQALAPVQVGRLVYVPLIKK